MPRLLAPFVADAELTARWDHPQWAAAPPVSLSHFRPEGTGHRPAVQARLAWSRHALHGVFRVEDRYVLSLHTRPNDPVYRDSCVEFFARPLRRRSYFHFEWNAGGTLLAGEVFNPERTAEGFKRGRRLTGEELCLAGAVSTLPAVVDPEVEGPLLWGLGFALPFALLGGVTPEPGMRWRCNFFKCGDATSHPHWASWTRLPERNFHLPKRFGTLEFG